MMAFMFVKNPLICTDMYSKDQYLRMIEKFNKMSFSDQMDTIIQNPTILNVYIHVDIKGIDEAMKDEIGKENWFKINQNENRIS